MIYPDDKEDLDVLLEDDWGDLDVLLEDLHNLYGLRGVGDLYDLDVLLYVIYWTI